LNFKSFFFLEGYGKLLSFLFSRSELGTGHLLEGGWGKPKQFAAVVGLMGSEHAMESK
jgi:hypothetical protein